MADIFDVVADPTRRQLLARLLSLAHAEGRDGEISVGRLVAELGISQPTVSKHLKTLREHGLVAVRDEGQHRFYRLDPSPLDEISDWIAPFVAEPEPVEGAIVDDVADPVTAWAGTRVAERVGRVAADAVHLIRR